MICRDVGNLRFPSQPSLNRLQMLLFIKVRGRWGNRRFPYLTDRFQILFHNRIVIFIFLNFGFVASKKQ